MLYKTSIFLQIILLLASFFVQATECKTESVHLKVGVLASWGVEYSMKAWKPMMSYLNENVDCVIFEVKALSFEQMYEQIQSKKINFIITNPAHYVNISNKLPLSWLATMKSRNNQETTSAIGSAIIVRSDSNIYNLVDLKNKIIVASGKQALGGYKAALYEFMKKKIPIDSVKQVKFLGFPLDKLIYEVFDKKADAAITPFCTLEHMVKQNLIKKNDFRVLNDITPKGYDCAVSTTLYPNWSFAASDIDPKVTRQITEALFKLPKNHPASISADISGWTAPISQYDVIQLFNGLNTPTVSQRIIQIVKEKEELIFGILIFVILATIYHFILEYKIRQKGNKLLLAEQELHQKTIQLERIKNSAILGEIGASLAHELNQPIASITQYSEGGMIGNKFNLELLSKINHQSRRAGQIVHRIRNLLQQHTIKKDLLYIDDIVKESLELLELNLQRIKVIYSIKHEPYQINADRIGLLQVFINLLKNSIDALECSKKPTIKLEVNYLHNGITIMIIDSGVGLPQDSYKLFDSFVTNKKDGLGLGLTICLDLIQKHGGTLELKNNEEEEGCSAIITLPKLI